MVHGKGDPVPRTDGSGKGDQGPGQLLQPLQPRPELTLSRGGGHSCVPGLDTAAVASGNGKGDRKNDNHPSSLH